LIGVFDSGVGGITAVRELRRLLPTADVIFFPDRKNAPYGTRSREELIFLVERDIEILLSYGANTVLMACCTASTVHPYLKGELQRIAVPIIEPTARAAAKATESGRVAVIATEATVRSGQFGEMLRSLHVPSISEIAAGDLVTAVERGARDGHVTSDTVSLITRYTNLVKEQGADTLILGCTHFPHLEGEIKKLLPRVKIISSSREGAIEAVKGLRANERGRTVYIGHRTA